MPEDITLAELIADALDSRLAKLHTAMPGKVQSYDASKQTADVIPQLNRAMPTSDGGIAYEQLPVLPNVPVAFPRGGGAFVSFPLQPGDYVLVVFCERDINVWRDKGEQCDPGDLEMHGPTPAVAIPCNLYPASQPLASADANNLVVGFDSGAQIQVTPGPAGEVLLGAGTAADPVVKGNELKAALTALANQLLAAAADPVLAALCSTAATALFTAGTALNLALPSTLSAVTMTE